MCRRGDERRDASRPPAACRSPASRCAASTSRAATVARGEPGEVAGPRLQRDARLPRRSGRDGRGDRRGRLAAHRRRRRARRRGAICASPTASRTCSSSAASTAIRRRSRSCWPRIPAIAQVAVVGVPDERLGEVGQGVRGPPPGRGARRADAVIAWCRDNMANYKVPRRVEFVDALPTNAAGKVQKFALRAALPA